MISETNAEEAGASLRKLLHAVRYTTFRINAWAACHGQPLVLWVISSPQWGGHGQVDSKHPKTPICSQPDIQSQVNCQSCN